MGNGGLCPLGKWFIELVVITRDRETSLQLFMVERIENQSYNHGLSTIQVAIQHATETDSEVKKNQVIVG